MTSNAMDPVARQLTKTYDLIHSLQKEERSLAYTSLKQTMKYFSLAFCSTLPGYVLASSRNVYLKRLAVVPVAVSWFFSAKATQCILSGDRHDYFLSHYDECTAELNKVSKRLASGETVDLEDIKAIERHVEIAEFYLDDPLG